MVANNVLAQVPELNDFVAGIELVLAPHGVVTIEVPHIVRLVEELQFDTIYHEHYSYFSLTTLVTLLRHHGLEIFDVDELRSHGGSLRVYARRKTDDSHPVEASVGRLLARERHGGYTTLEGYLDFSRRVTETKWALVELLIGLRRDGKRVVGYGAPGKGNTLLNYCGIRTDLLEYTVDRNPHKQGKYLPGTHIPIYAPDMIDATRPDYILILPWNLEREIAAQLACIREWGAQLIVPIPSARVIREHEPGDEQSEDRRLLRRARASHGRDVCSHPETVDPDRRQADPLAHHELLLDFGATDFVLCLGYKADAIKEYFLTYNEALSNDFVLRDGGKQLELLQRDIHDWSMTFVNTGLNELIGQRLRKVCSRYLEDDEMFLATYGDCLTDAPLPDMIATPRGK